MRRCAQRPEPTAIYDRRGDWLVFHRSDHGLVHA